MRPLPLGVNRLVGLPVAVALLCLLPVATAQATNGTTQEPPPPNDDCVTVMCQPPPPSPGPALLGLAYGLGLLVVALVATLVLWPRNRRPGGGHQRR